MSAPKLLIPLSYLNEACFLSLNIDEKKFKMVLKIAQEDLRDKNVKDKREMTGTISYDGDPNHPWHYSENMLRGKEIVFKMICDCTKIEDSEDTFKEKLTS